MKSFKKDELEAVINKSELISRLTEELKTEVTVLHQAQENLVVRKEFLTYGDSKRALEIYELLEHSLSILELSGYNDVDASLKQIKQLG